MAASTCTEFAEIEIHRESSEPNILVSKVATAGNHGHCILQTNIHSKVMDPTQRGNWEFMEALSVKHLYVRLLGEH